MSSNFCSNEPPKIGLDDFCVLEGKNAAKAFMALPEEIYEESARLWKLNERLAFINKVGKVYDLKYERFYTSRADFLYAFANEIYAVPKANGEGFKEVNAAELWLKWRHRLEFDELNYLPGQPPIVGRTLNIWPGYGCEPKKGSVKEILELVRHLLGKDRKAEKWLWQWFAYPLQHPVTKLSQAVIFHSLTQGVGKSLLGEIMGDIYGENFNIVSQDELHAPFNEWLVCKQFIVGEEITGRNSRVDEGRLKNMITRQQFTVNKKNQPTYTQNDYLAYLFLSNQPDAAFLDDNDRRYFVHEIAAEAKSDAFYKRVSKWRRAGGASHLFYYLLHEVDTSDFNPKAKPPLTESKKQMIEISKSDLDVFASDIIRNPRSVFNQDRVPIEGDLFELAQIAALAVKRCNRFITTTATGKALRRAGFADRPVKVSGETLRLWPLRNTEAWRKREGTLWATHYKKIEKWRKI